MDPLPPMLTGLSSGKEADTPRTRDLKHLRAKRVAYYESIGVIKSAPSGSGSRPVSAVWTDTQADPSGNPAFGLRAPESPPHHVVTRQRPLLQRQLRAPPGEAELCEGQRSQTGPGTESHPAKLDLHLLADASVPETQKLRHVLRWAQQFLSKPLKEYDLESPGLSGGLSPSSTGSSSNVLVSGKNTHLRPSDCAPLPSEGQSYAQTGRCSSFLSPQRNFSTVQVHSELLRGSIPGCLETPVRSEGEGRAASSSPDSLQLEDSMEGKSERAEDSSVRSLSEDETLSARLGVPPPLRFTSEEGQALEKTGQSPHTSSYFWSPLMDSSEDEGMVEPVERKGMLPRGDPGRNNGEFLCVTWSPPRRGAFLLKPRLLSDISDSGRTFQEPELREAVHRGAAEHPVATSEEVTVDIVADSSKGEDLIQRLQPPPLSHSSQGWRKESDKVRMTLRCPHTITKRKKQAWNHALTESAGETVLEKFPEDTLRTSLPSSSAKSCSSGMTWKHFDLTHPNSDSTSQTAGLSLNVCKGPSHSAVFHLHPGTRNPAEDVSGGHDSSGLEQLPSPETPGGSVPRAYVDIREMTREQKEEALPLGHLAPRNISRAALHSSSPVQELGSSLPQSEVTPHEPERGASVLETYFYYLQVLNKIRGSSSEEGHSPLPLQGPRAIETELVTMPPEGKEGSRGSGKHRKTQGPREGLEDSAVMEGGVYSATSKMTSEKRSQEVAPSGCSARKHGDVKSRCPRPSSAETEENACMRTSPGACAIGAVEKPFCMNVLRGAERGMKGQEGATSFSQWLLLPDELWISVFSFLSHKELARVAQVCHHFHRLASDNCLCGAHRADSLPEAAVHLLSDSLLPAPGTELCDCKGKDRITSGLSITYKDIGGGKQIQIEDCCALEDDWLVSLADHQPRSLTLHRCCSEGQAVTHSGLRQLFQHCSDVLQELNVTSCSGPGLTGDEVLLHAGTLCHRLTRVNLSWSGATNAGVMALIQGASSLQELSINGCRITDKAIKALVKKHGNSLYKIEVFGCLALTSRSVDSMAVECPHLRTLNIGRISSISESCLSRSLENLREVTALNVTALPVVRDRIVSFIVTHCPKLESLVLSSCSQVTDVSLLEISIYLHNLRYLDISGCQQVTNAGIYALARSCHQLKYLDLSSTGISKRGVCLLANYCHASLECVKLSFCKNITLDVVKKLCKNCRRLKILHLYGCTITSDLCKIKEAYKRVQVFHNISTLNT